MALGTSWEKQHGGIFALIDKKLKKIWKWWQCDLVGESSLAVAVFEISSCI